MFNLINNVTDFLILILRILDFGMKKGLTHPRVSDRFCYPAMFNSVFASNICNVLVWDVDNACLCWEWIKSTYKWNTWKGFAHLKIMSRGSHGLLMP